MQEGPSRQLAILLLHVRLLWRNYRAADNTRHGADFGAAHRSDNEFRVRAASENRDYC